MGEHNRFRRKEFHSLLKRLQGRRGFLQVLEGPRQTGKTTTARQLAEAIGIPAIYASADSAQAEDRSWIEAQWDRARTQAKAAGRGGALLILDEVQKVPGWSAAVKRLWDEDSASDLALKVLILGSAALLVQRGLTESLAGRFETIRAGHWSFPEMEAAFGWDLETYLFFGGYPGSVSLSADEERWRRYILDSLVETTVSRDILLLNRVDKPALLRRLFFLACQYSGQILSFNKMVGQLQDAGNTTTLAHYLDLLASAGMVAGVPKYAGDRARQRGSSPKLLALNTALLSATTGRPFGELRGDPDLRGRVVETAIGAHLLNTSAGTSVEVFYWREGNKEVDFVLREGRSLVAIEVKSGRRTGALPGLAAFSEAFRPRRRLLVGPGGIPLDEFLRKGAAEWVRG